MGEEIGFENCRISDFQGLVTLTLDWVILCTVMHHSSTSNYMPHFIEIEETFCGRMDGHLRPTLLGLLTRVDLKIKNHWILEPFLDNMINFLWRWVTDSKNTNTMSYWLLNINCHNHYYQSPCTILQGSVASVVHQTKKSFCIIV